MSKQISQYVDYKLSEFILWLLDGREIRCRFDNQCLQFNPLGLLAGEKRILGFLLCDVKIKGYNSCEQIDREETAHEDEHREEQREVFIAVLSRASITGIDKMPEVIWPTLKCREHKEKQHPTANVFHVHIICHPFTSYVRTLEDDNKMEIP